MTAAESQSHVIAQAMRQSLVADAKRARANVPGGIALVVIGGAMVATVLLFMSEPQLLVLVLGVGIGTIMGCFGLAVLGRSWATIASSRKKIRELELPRARVVR